MMGARGPDSSWVDGRMLLLWDLPGNFGVPALDGVVRVGDWEMVSRKDYGVYVIEDRLDTCQEALTSILFAATGMECKLYKFMARAVPDVEALGLVAIVVGDEIVIHGTEELFARFVHPRYVINWPRARGWLHAAAALVHMGAMPSFTDADEDVRAAACRFYDQLGITEKGIVESMGVIFRRLRFACQVFCVRAGWGLRPAPGVDFCFGGLEVDAGRILRRLDRLHAGLCELVEPFDIDEFDEFWIVLREAQARLGFPTSGVCDEAMFAKIAGRDEPSWPRLRSSASGLAGIADPIAKLGWFGRRVDAEAAKCAENAVQVAAVVKGVADVVQQLGEEVTQAGALLRDASRAAEDAAADVAAFAARRISIEMRVDQLERAAARELRITHALMVVGLVVCVVALLTARR